jgi:ribulose-phosphate 3-epimerase
VQINPSILSADFGNLERDLLKISSADAAHIDVMDNHFVPNLTIGLPVVKRLQEISPIPLDVHLMITNVDSEALRYAELGVDSITFHLEASENPAQTIATLQQMGTKVAIAIKPGTPVEASFPHLEQVDMLLIMTVEPGFGGQKLIESTLHKISSAAKAIRRSGRSVTLQVDGGVTQQNIAKIASLGANCAVAGSAVFASGDPEKNIADLKSAAIINNA